MADRARQSSTFTAAIAKVSYLKYNQNMEIEMAPVSEDSDTGAVFFGYETKFFKIFFCSCFTWLSHHFRKSSVWTRYWPPSFAAGSWPVFSIRSTTNRDTFKISVKSVTVRNAPCWDQIPTGVIVLLLGIMPSQAVKAGSIPVPCSKKEVTFVYQKLLLFLSKPQAWHIISPDGAVYHPSPCDGISSRQSRV